MPRPRKYDYQNDYPVTLHIKVPIILLKQLEEIGYTQTAIQKELESAKIVERFLVEFVEKNRKKD